MRKHKKISRTTPTEIQRQIYLDDLKALNVTESRAGRSLDELSCSELHHELVIASFRNIDVTSDANRWY